MAAPRPRRKSPPARGSALLGLQKVDLFKGLASSSLREIAAQCKWTRCKRNSSSGSSTPKKKTKNGRCARTSTLTSYFQ